MCVVILFAKSGNQLLGDAWSVEKDNRIVCRNVSTRNWKRIEAGGKIKKNQPPFGSASTV